MATCKKCNAENAEFYKSNPNKCKPCVRASSRAYRAANIDRVRTYDRVRHVEGGSRGEASVEARLRARTRWLANNKQKRAAHVAVSNAVRDGKLVNPGVCSACKSSHRDVEAHHDDYSLKLDVRWLCVPCHSAHHRRYDHEEDLAKLGRTS